MRFHRGLYEVHLPVTDMDRSIDFYVGKFAFELGFGGRGESSTLLNSGGSLMVDETVIQRYQPRKPCGNIYGLWRLSDLRRNYFR